MKVLDLDYSYYYYPQGIDGLDEFVEYANKHYDSFIKLKCFETEKCVFPYLISDHTKDIYVNVASLGKISEVEVTVLSASEYDARLKQVVAEKCIDCVHYKEETEGDNLKGHRDRISLDGECWGYEKKE